MSNADYRGFEMLFENLNAATRRMQQAQAALPGAKVLPLRQPVDLRVQLERALIELEDAAALVEVHYPIIAKKHRRTAQQIRNLVAGA